MDWESASPHFKPPPKTDPPVPELLESAWCATSRSSLAADVLTARTLAAEWKDAVLAKASLKS